MEKYIALLRGVNVGGKNTVSMPVLKAEFENAGFYNVGTYINSGNIFFSGCDTDIELLQKRCAQIIAAKFNINISVAVISAEALADALLHAPEWWGRDEDSKHNAIFVIHPANAEAIVEDIGETKPEYERVSRYGQVIFWSAPVKTFSKTRWSKVSSTAAYANITIRNANTTKKILQLSTE